VLAFAHPRPRHVVLGFDEAILRDLQMTIDRGAFDVGVAYGLEVADYLSRADAPRLQRVFDACEPFQFDDATSTVRNRLRVWKLRHYLRAVLRDFDAYTAVSDLEQSWIRHYIRPEVPITAVIPNGSDVFPPYRGPVDPFRIIYTGSITYFANREAVNHFLTRIWPILRGRIPNCRFVITGTIPKDVTQYASLPGVTIAGLVDDFTTFVSSSAALAVPLQRGGGTRVKILEAMALGCPVVANRKAVEGLDVRTNQDVLIAEEPKAFADALFSVLTDNSLRQQLIDNGRQVSARYSWSRSIDNFVKLIESLTPDDSASLSSRGGRGFGYSTH
jgi:glycosyltransferase involved in cell wall biosynthesis